MIERLPGLLLILGSVITESLGHIAFKKAADFGHHGKRILSVLRLALEQYKWINLGIACFVAKGLCWTFALKTLDVSLAYPISGLELVVIMVLCRLLLKERVGLHRWLGVTLITIGTLLVTIS
jgi:undecaprenyl phosphate-alpha-L-ara4N flippase subunit ArnE